MSVKMLLLTSLFENGTNYAFCGVVILIKLIGNSLYGITQFPFSNSIVVIIDISLSNLLVINLLHIATINSKN